MIVTIQEVHSLLSSMCKTFFLYLTADDYTLADKKLYELQDYYFDGRRRCIFGGNLIWSDLWILTGKIDNDLKHGRIDLPCAEQTFCLSLGTFLDQRINDMLSYHCSRIDEFLDLEEDELCLNS